MEDEIWDRVIHVLTKLGRFIQQIGEWNGLACSHKYIKYNSDLI